MAQPATGGSAVNRDLGYKVKPIASILSIVGNNTTEGTGTGVDLKGYEGAQVIFNVGSSGDTLATNLKIDLSVQDSPDNSNWTALDAAQYRVDAGLTAIDGAADDEAVTVITVLPGTGVDRYIRALATFTGTHTNGTPIGAVVVKGFPRVAPAA
jgi:hypothetical protein